MAVNGSNSTGRCSNFIPSITCTTPTSSVLFDGNVPTLTGLDGDMWASRLLTINATANTAKVIFDFTDTPDYTRVERVEVVMFNCPEWGISVTTIQLFGDISISENRIPGSTINPTTTTCDSLVIVCISEIVSLPVIILVFNLSSTSNWVHLAEVTFYASGSICPPDTIITPPPPTTPKATVSPIPTTIMKSTNINILVNTTSMKNYTTANTLNITMIKDTMTGMKILENITEIAAPSSDPTIVIIIAVVATSIILIIVTIIVILILYKLYSTKHKNYKHNANTDTALRESYTTRQQHNPHSERGHANLCKETGQVYYSTPEDGVGEADSSHQIYSRLTHDTHNTGEQSQDTGMDSTLQGNYEMGEYSTVSNCKQLHGVTGKEVSAANQSLPQLFYTQAVNNPIKKDEDKDSADPQEWPPSAIYAQVDKKKSPSQTPEPYTPLNQMYAQVDKKKSKKREVSEDPPCESGDVYSVVNKPSAPEIPQKSQLLLEDLTITQPLQ